MIKKIWCTFVISILVGLSIQAQPKHEVRAVWLTTIGGLDWPHNYAQSERSRAKQQAELQATLDQLQAAGVNTILLQTRIRGTVIYPSDYEPWDGCLSGIPGTSPGYDALQFAIDECHKRGMAVQAWLVSIPVGKWNGLGCKRLRQRYPQLIVKIGDEGYMNPEKPQTATHIAKLCQEIVSKYDVDGIHLDYIRYPEAWDIKVRAEQGRTFITNIVTAASNAVKAIKPWVRISCSPIGKANDLPRYWSHGWNAYTRVLQNAQQWLADGLMDELYPMMYFKGNHFYPFALDWQEQAQGKIVVPGLGIYMMAPQEKNWPLIDITREMLVARHIGMGHAYFRSNFFTDNTKDIYTIAAEDIDSTPALLPALTWYSQQQPASPTDVHTTATQITWQTLPNCTYNLYSSEQWPVDTEKAENLMLVRYANTQLNIPAGNQRYYALTAMDRYGNESLPTQCNEKKTPPDSDALLCTGNTLRIPNNYNANEGLLTLSALDGTLLQTLSVRNNVINMQGIADGIYQLRTLNAADVSHHIAFVIVKRF